MEYQVSYDNKEKIPVTQEGSLLYTDNLYSGSTFVIWLKLENVSVTVMNGNEADNIFYEKTYR